MSTEKLVGSSQNLVEEIKSGDRNLLQGLYHDLRPEFIRWANRYFQCNEDVAGEAYQRAFIILYYNIRDGKLTELSSSIKTYLFAIGKNVLREQFKSKFFSMDHLDSRIEVDTIDVSIMEKYEQSDMKELVRGLLLRIGEPCKTVLELFYFRDFSMEAIATELGYKTEQIAAKRKFICLQQVRTLMSDN